MGGWVQPSEGTLGYCTWAQEAISTKVQAVAYKTIGTFLSDVEMPVHRPPTRRAMDRSRAPKAAAIGPVLPTVD